MCVRAHPIPHPLLWFPINGNGDGLVGSPAHMPPGLPCSLKCVEVIKFNGSRLATVAIYLMLFIWKFTENRHRCRAKLAGKKLETWLTIFHSVRLPSAQGIITPFSACERTIVAHHFAIICKNGCEMVSFGNLPVQIVRRPSTIPAGQWVRMSTENDTYTFVWTTIFSAVAKSYILLENIQWNYYKYFTWLRSINLVFSCNLIAFPVLDGIQF